MSWTKALAKHGDPLPKLEMHRVQKYIVVDCEGGPAPGSGDLREFGAVCLFTHESFHGCDSSAWTFHNFETWINEVCAGARPVFVSDNPAFDWQWINYHFWLSLGHNPFGHSARRIGDFYAGLKQNFRETQGWKKLRRTKHDHNPVHDALGNAEALETLLSEDPLLGEQ